MVQLLQNAQARPVRIAVACGAVAFGLLFMKMNWFDNDVAIVGAIVAVVGVISLVWCLLAKQN